MEKIKKLPKTLIVIIVVLVLMIISNSMVITDVRNYKVITQFGRVMRVESDPGLSFKIPFIQGERTVPKYKMLSDLTPSDVTTKDKKVMTVDSFVIWKIDDPVKYWETLNMTISNAEFRLGNITYNGVKTIMSQKTQDDIISGRNGQIAKSIFDMTSPSATEYGLKMYAVETKKLDLPDSNKEAVYNRMISERNTIAASYTSNGNYEATKIKNAADKEEKQIVATANESAEKTKADAEAEYMRILSNAYNDSDKANFYSYVRKLDALKTSLKGSNKRTIILDQNSEFAKVLQGNIN